MFFCINASICFLSEVNNPKKTFLLYCMSDLDKIQMWLKWLIHNFAQSKSLSNQEWLRNQCLFRQKLIILNEGFSVKSGLRILDTETMKGVVRILLTLFVTKKRRYLPYCFLDEITSTVPLMSWFWITLFLDFLNSYSRAPSSEYRKQVLQVVSACLETNIHRWYFFMSKFFFFIKLGFLDVKLVSLLYL